MPADFIPLGADMSTNYLFTLPDQNGNDFAAADHLPLVLYFYPKDSTPGCTTEAQ